MEVVAAASVFRGMDRVHRAAAAVVLGLDDRFGTQPIVAVDDIEAEVAAMRDTPVPEAELNDAKRAIVAGFALSLESPQQLLGYYVQNWLYGLPADYWDTYPAKISAVTAAQVQAAAAKYWEASKLQIVAVGDAGKITDILKKKGTLETFDADGKPVK